MTDMNAHLDADLVAQLADHGPDAVDPSALRHLASCESCYEAYAEAAVYGVAVDLGYGPPPLPMDVLAALADSGGTATSARRPRRVSARRWPVLRSLAAAAVLALVLLLGIRGLGPGRSPETPPPAVVASLAAGNGLLFPETAAALVTDVPAYRGDLNSDTALREATDELAKEFADRDRPTTAYHLGLARLASGRLEAAEDLSLRLRRERADDPRGLRLAAAIAYRRSELARADSLLGRLASLAPDDDIVRFNQALLAAEMGHVERARTLLATLSVVRTGTVLSTRVDDLKNRLER